MPRWQQSTSTVSGLVASLYYTEGYQAVRMETWNERFRANSLAHPVSVVVCVVALMLSVSLQISLLSLSTARIA